MTEKEMIVGKIEHVLGRTEGHFYQFRAQKIYQALEPYLTTISNNVEPVVDE